MIYRGTNEPRSTRLEALNASSIIKQAPYRIAASLRMQLHLFALQSKEQSSHVKIYGCSHAT